MPSQAWGAGEAVPFTLTPLHIHLTLYCLLTLNPPPLSPLCEEAWSAALPTPHGGGRSWRRSLLLWLPRPPSVTLCRPAVAHLSLRQICVSLQSPPTLPHLLLRLGTADWHSETTARVHPHCEAEVTSNENPQKRRVAIQSYTGQYEKRGWIDWNPFSPAWSKTCSKGVLGGSVCEDTTNGFSVLCLCLHVCSEMQV